jgi:hypothetical protein
LQHVTSPPHEFTEEPDGTLTITPSIAATMHGASGSGLNTDGWHGFLTRGHWHWVGDV